MQTYVIEHNTNFFFFFLSPVVLLESSTQYSGQALQIGWCLIYLASFSSGSLWKTTIVEPYAGWFLC